MKNIIPKIIFLVYIGCLAYLLFGSADEFPEAPATIFGIPTDKIVHFGMFFPLSILIWWSFDWKLDRGWKKFLFVIGNFVFSSVVAGCTELLQRLTPDRTCDISDFAVDTLSIALSCIFVLLFVVGKRIH